jgi:S-adenosylmethionine synthetase
MAMLFSSESVTEGHPDKVADAISDTILDAYLKQDPESLVACETLVTTGQVILAGEVSTGSKSFLDHTSLVREKIREIGYRESGVGFDADSCGILTAIHEQSRDIRQGVKRADADIGAGDQGLMFGYACRETPELMPLPIACAHRITRKLAELRHTGALKWLRPDGKSQVTVEYEGQIPRRIHTIVVSTQHAESVTQEEIQSAVKTKILDEVLPKELLPQAPILHINPTGRFVIGGPHGDSGLTGRKIIVDTYGGMAPHGGGAFSGKDPTKVDRSASYLARHIAKNVVASGLADRCLIQLSYSIGVAEPVGVFLEDYGTAKVDPKKLLAAVREIFPMKPAQIIQNLKLRRPIYAKTTNYGHFGRQDADFTWEQTEHAQLLRKALGA